MENRRKICYETPEARIRYVSNEDILTTSEIIAGEGYFIGDYGEVWE